MVGPTGFEPATSPTPRERATKLRYGPTQLFEKDSNENAFLKQAIFSVYLPH